MNRRDFFKVASVFSLGAITGGANVLSIDQSGQEYKPIRVPEVGKQMVLYPGSYYPTYEFPVSNIGLREIGSYPTAISDLGDSVIQIGRSQNNFSMCLQIRRIINVVVVEGATQGLNYYPGVSATFGSVVSDSYIVGSAPNVIFDLQTPAQYRLWRKEDNGLFVVRVPCYGIVGGLAGYGSEISGAAHPLFDDAILAAAYPNVTEYWWEGFLL